MTGWNYLAGRFLVNRRVFIAPGNPLGELTVLPRHNPFLNGAMPSKICLLYDQAQILPSVCFQYLFVPPLSPTTGSKLGFGTFQTVSNRFR